MDYEKIGKHIRAARVAKNLTLEDVGEMLGMNYSSVGKMERGERRPTLDTIEQLSIIFGVTIDYLLGKSDEPKLTADQNSIITAEAMKLYEIIESLPEGEKDEIIKEVIGYVKVKSNKGL
ncbi:helix-turn-helix transcriptional regulator [Cytobacillus sp. IB215665]|uniref:helix-turn-helix domain-containing protein n=1 Tax=Cytobacillus sp. IB215665 TaxID=3097357 RepID=UPI002A11F2BD|nr:helix-turn-helix transcriptional regulator [Cytobacillus sp. IB215665]MDX8367824.1 helix-turn-helix transcriptional regulator [Cytobacillus sp. IB215665]